MLKEIEIFEKFIRSRGLRYTSQREAVLEAFLSTEKHVSVDELYRIVGKKDRGIGYTTVYRTMKLLSGCGLCEEADFGDGIIRYEHKYGHDHHDHLICMKCGMATEVVKQEIEELQNELARKHRFMPVRHKLEIFGICKKCSK